MSVVKLLSRIVAPTENELTPDKLAHGKDRDMLLHDHTHEIVSMVQEQNTWGARFCSGNSSS